MSEEETKCPACQGSGNRFWPNNIEEEDRACPKCKGTGRIDAAPLLDDEPRVRLQRAGIASPVEFNINDYVMVKLTDYGRQCLHKNYNDLKASYGGKLGFDYTPPKEDEDGWSKWQAWSLMAELGKHILMGFTPPFETTIKVMLNAEVSDSAATGAPKSKL